MATVPRPRDGSTGPTHDAASAVDKPKLGQPYLDWLERAWLGDMRELREGRYLHQQADLRQAFETSPFWEEVAAKLQRWADSYKKKTKAPLFQGVPTLPSLVNKSWQSFLSRTWRENVDKNRNWDGEPDDGWWLPDNWFERAWDIVRMRFVVRDLDGARELAEQLRDCATRRPFKLETELDEEAKPNGYYGYHVYVRQLFSVAALDYDGEQKRSSQIEIQVMTQMAEVISELTHPYYEQRRGSGAAGMLPLLDPTSEEADAVGLGQQSRELERKVLQLRMKIHDARAKDLLQRPG
jgi:Region found in RelA / SpoT proteins